MNKHFNLADLFEMVADHVPERDALVCGENRATYSKLEERANRLAHFLISQGIGAGDHVGLYMYNCNEYIEGMLACFKIRAVPINVNYRYVDDELSYIFENSDLVACIHHREFIQHIDNMKGKIFKLKLFIAVDDFSGEDLEKINAVSYETVLAESSPKRDFIEREDNDLFILYTGGTTGMPKGVMWPHKNVFFAAMGGAGFYHPDGPIKVPEEITTRITEKPIVGMALAPLMHGACWWYACIQLLIGGVVVLNPARSLIGEEVWEIVEREKVNGLSIVGDAMAIPLLDAVKANPKRWNLSSIFSVGSGGAVFSNSKQAEFKKYFPDVFVTNAFGSSESGNMGMDSGNRKSEGGLGNVVRSEFMDVIIEAENNNGLARHADLTEMGIFSRSGYIPVGYYNDEEKTSRTFVTVDDKIWLLTGDEARLENDNSISVYGRGSNCINSGGEKIFPEEVEQALKAHPDIFDALVVGTPDERWGSKVTAIIATRDGKILSLLSVQSEARKHIAGYKVPRELHIVDSVPRAPSGKPAYPEAKKIALNKNFLVN